MVTTRCGGRQPLAPRCTSNVGSSCHVLPAQVEILEFDADTDTLRREASFWHKPEVWAIAPSPEDARLFITVHNDGGQSVSLLVFPLVGLCVSAADAHRTPCMAATMASEKCLQDAVPQAARSSPHSAPDHSWFSRLSTNVCKQDVWGKPVAHHAIARRARGKSRAAI